MEMTSANTKLLSNKNMTIDSDEHYTRCRRLQRPAWVCCSIGSRSSPLSRYLGCLIAAFFRFSLTVHSQFVCILLASLPIQMSCFWVAKSELGWHFEGSIIRLCYHSLAHCKAGARGAAGLPIR
jgi:hypothetical protein